MALAGADITGIAAATWPDAGAGGEPAPLPATVAGMDAELHVSGALHWPSAGTLVVSDLHLETGSSFARRRVFVPPYDTALTLDRLEAAIAATRPRRVISLGDSFHDPFGAERMPEPFRRRLCALAAGREWIWISGNHDRGCAAGMPGEAADEIVLHGVAFRHVPTAGPAAAFEVAGPLHPSARILGGGRSVRRRCFAGCGARLVMPAFGVLTGGLNVCDPAFRPIWPRLADVRVFMIGRRAVYPIPSDALVPG